jgi:uncharacterized protein (TIGR02271 family)
MITEQQLGLLIGSSAVGPDGPLGTVVEVYLDDETHRPEWAAVRTGLLGTGILATGEAFVPLAPAEMAGDDLWVPYDEDTVRNAPRIVSEGHLSPAEEMALYRYYGVGWGGGSAVPAAETTRSEEQLRVGTERVEAGRARLRRYVVAENVTRTVPVSHEEIRLDREPIPDADAVEDGTLTEEAYEVVLYAERPLVTSETVPVERVRLDTRTVTDQQTVVGQVRREQIDVEADAAIRRS